MTALEVCFWTCAGLLVHTHLAYPALIALIARLRPRPVSAGLAHLPPVSLIVACHDEVGVIGERVRNALALDYPASRFELIVASDGSTDGSVGRARGAVGPGARALVLDLPRAGKVAAQNAAARQARGAILAFSDANSLWEPGALRELVAPFADPAVGYVCGRAEYLAPDGDNQEGAYWRYEMAVRKAESRAGSITAGNGAIYATRATTYVELDERMGHDLALPFNVVKRGARAIFAPAARARERMVPSTRGESRRKRRMMARAWLIMLRGGMLDPRGYEPLYFFQVLSHRLLRYASPFLHLGALASSAALVALGAGTLYEAALAAQAGLVVAAAFGLALPLRPLKLATYYCLVTLAPALGLWDLAREGAPATWEKAAGTR